MSRLQVRKFKPTQCPQGHSYTLENTYWQYRHGPDKGATAVCKTCDKDRMARKRENPEFRAKGAAATRRWREKDPERTKATEHRAYEKRNKWIQDQKTKCKTCSESRFPCLDFHHRDSGEKLGTIGQIRHWKRERLAAEIAKCDVICANCHRWLHWKEKQTKSVEGA